MATGSPSPDELRIPTVPTEAEVLCADGRTFVGRIFVSATSPLHAGPMRPDEWMNDEAPFFPFLPAGEHETVILNKQEVLVLTVSAVETEDEPPVIGPERALLVECRGRALTGTIVSDLPAHQARVLDYLNQREPFLTLRDGQRRHLVRKAAITRVVEARAS